MDIPNVDNEKLKNMSKEDDDGHSKCSPYKLNSSAESDTVPKATDNYGPDMSMQTCEKQSNSSANLLDNSFTEQVVYNSVPSLQQDRPLPSLKFLLDSINGVHSIDQQPCQSPVEEVLKRPIFGNEAEELGTSVQTTNLSNESMEENNTLNLNNGKLETSSGFHELSIEAQGAPNHQNVASDHVAMVNPVQRGEGQSSFSVAGPVSGLLTYSGPIAFSGSNSVRSNSSTTSTRSFAFPVLLTEWNSSLVRMAKADRRCLQKHRQWRHGLLCCRF